MSEEPQTRAAAFDPLEGAIARLAGICAGQRPMAPSLRALVRLSAAIGAGRIDRLRALADEALDAGCDLAALEQVAFLAFEYPQWPQGLEALAIIREQAASTLDRP